ncbi:DUF4340 domain-containing protein [bacterium]|nr:DUF4340 domain-containing protein [bacterium]
MKFKTTLILLVVFLVLLGGVFLIQHLEKGKKEQNKLVALSPDNAEKIVFNTGKETIAFEKDSKGNWMISQPLQAQADNNEVNRLASDFSDLAVERVVEEEASNPKKYEIPQKEVTLHFKDREQPVKILVGSKNALDNTFFAKREKEPRIVLIPSRLSSVLENTLVDFRKKDIFSFPTNEVQKITLQAQDLQWKAVKKENQWFLQQPVEALAQKSVIQSLLSSLSGLKAETFLTEEKTEKEIKNYFLDNPTYKVQLILPVENQKVEFLLQEKEEKLVATTSLSPKIIQAEKTLVSDLTKKVNELREKEVASFYSWGTKKLAIQRGEQKFVLSKDEEDNWNFRSPVQKKADKNKVETFIRKIENLEAEEFIDLPLELKDYGLDSPQVKIQVFEEKKKEEEKSPPVTILVGKENKDENTVVVKNARFDYLFRVDSEFLENLPQSPEDWVQKTGEKRREEKTTQGKRKEK